MRRAFVLSVAPLFALVACKEHPKPEVTMVRASPEGVVLEVAAPPGLSVSVDVEEDDGPRIGADGVAEVTLPLEKLAHYDGASFTIMVAGQKLLTSYFGDTEVHLPVAGRGFSRIPKANADGTWFAFLGEKIAANGGETIEAGDGFAGEWGIETTDAAAKVSVLHGGPSATLVFAAPPKAKIEIAGFSLASDDSGIASADVPIGVIALGATMQGLAAPPYDLHTPVVVKLGDAKHAFTLDLRTDPLYGASILGFLATRLDEVAMGNALPDVGAAVDAVVLRTYDGSVAATGREGPVHAARWVAIEHATHRTGGSCDYTTFSLDREYDDVDVVVVDRDGAAVTKGHFTAPPMECPESAYSNSRLLERPPVADVLAWLKKNVVDKAKK